MYPSFFDELEKIAQETMEPSGLTQDERWITKDRLKRGLVNALVIGAATGLGHGAGKLIDRYVLQNAIKNNPSLFIKAAPAAAGMIGGIAGLLSAQQGRESIKYITHGNPKKPVAPKPIGSQPAEINDKPI